MFHEPELNEYSNTGVEIEQCLAPYLYNYNLCIIAFQTIGQGTLNLHHTEVIRYTE